MRPRGARHDIDVLGSALPTVSIHAPAGGATSTTSTAANIKPVSIHAPAGGATSSVTHVEVPDIPFQSTRPRGARLRYFSLPLQIHRFNPRARGGRDSNRRSVSPPFFLGFNPRARGGRDDTGLRPIYVDMHVSIHAPAGGATRIMLV